jgi:hypothetical protein
VPFAYRTQDLMARARTIDLTKHQTIDIIFMGDLHAGEAQFEHEMIRQAAAWLQEADNRYAVIPGDIFNTAIKGSVSLDLSEIGMCTKDARHLLARILEPVRERILAVLPGNHDDRSTRDTGEDSVDALCCELAIPYFPEGEAFLQILVGGWKHNDRPVSFYGYATHGTAGGRLPGAKANALLDMRRIIHNADWYSNGHGHTPLLIPEVAWYFDHKGNVREQSQWFISCGASLRRGGYPVKKAYPPLARIWPVLTLYGDGRKHMSATAEN